MKLTIRDPAILRQVGLLDVVAYLRASGWERGRSDDRASIWTKNLDERGEFEILLPTSGESVDYANRIAEGLVVLEDVEQRSQLEIIRDLTFASADIVRVRLPVLDDRDGSIPIEDGVALVDYARSMMFAAASSALVPRRVFASRRPAGAMEYLRNIRLGQTEQGSFVVTIISRVAPLLSPSIQGLIEVMDEPFPRVVTKTLAKALRGMNQAASLAASTGSFDSFEQTVQFGVSANLCEAIVGMSRSEQVFRELSVGLSWAPSRPIGDQTREQVVFRPDAIEVIGEAARLFREISPLEDVRVIGVVVRLQRAQNELQGEVTLSAIIEDKARTVIMRLGDEEYNLAIEAHRDKSPVTFLADVLREGRSFRATNVRDFHIARTD